MTDCSSRRCAAPMVILGAFSDPSGSSVLYLSCGPVVYAVTSHRTGLGARRGAIVFTLWLICGGTSRAGRPLLHLLSQSGFSGRPLALRGLPSSCRHAGNHSSAILMLLGVHARPW